jgi:hypothetical protein
MDKLIMDSHEATKTALMILEWVVFDYNSVAKMALPIAEGLGLCDEEGRYDPTSTRRAFHRRLRHAARDLVKLGLLARPHRGKYVITDLGRKMLAADGKMLAADGIDVPAPAVWGVYLRLIVKAFEGLGWRSCDSQSDDTVIFDREEDDVKRCVSIEYRDPGESPGMHDEYTGMPDEYTELIFAVREALRPALGDPIEVVDAKHYMVLTYDDLEIFMC